MSEPHQTPHRYEERQGLDWCRICGEKALHWLHALDGMVRSTDGWVYPEGTTMDEQYPILKFFAYQHLKEELQEVARPVHDIAWVMAETLPKNAETAAGLRKLLEAKDCFVRAAL